MATDQKHPLGRVLIVGGNGFLGHHIVRKARDEWSCSAIVSVDLRCTHNRLDGGGDGDTTIEYREVDITDLEALSKVFDAARPDVVIHTASPAAQSDAPGSHELMRRVNIGGTTNVVEASRRAGVKALVFTSSASVISDTRTDLKNADERWPVVRGALQVEYYSETKAAAEEVALAANRTGDSNLLTCAIRPAGIFGEGDVMVLKQMIRLHREGRTNVQVGDNNNMFDFTYVGNVAHAHLLAAHALLTTHASSIVPLDHERVDGEAFMITNDEPIYFWDFARGIWRYAGSDKGTSHVWTLGRTPGLLVGLLSEVAAALVGKKPGLTRSRIVYSCMARYYNITKAKTRLGYKPQVSLEEGIQKGVAWFREKDAAGEMVW